MHSKLYMGKCIGSVRSYWIAIYLCFVCHVLYFYFPRHLSVSDYCSYKHLLLEWNTGKVHSDGMTCAVLIVWLKQEDGGEASMRLCI